MKIGIDWGGTKIEAALLDKAGAVVWRQREATPSNDYDGSLAVVEKLVKAARKEAGGKPTIGVGIPGTISSSTGLVKNANSTWLNGRPLKKDLKSTLGQKVRIANDANCFALSEAVDGAGKGGQSVFGVILGTGVGGGFVLNGELNTGRMKIGSEWGHVPLPLSHLEKGELPVCWCGRTACNETFLSGPALLRAFQEDGGNAQSTEEVIELMRSGKKRAIRVFDQYLDRLARGLSMIVNILDPEVIVLGGGLSNVREIYENLPKKMKCHVFTDYFDTPIKQAIHGDSSGVRGAAWLWDEAKH